MARLLRSRWQTRASRVALEAHGMRPSTSISPSVSSSMAWESSGTPSGGAPLGSPPAVPAGPVSGTSVTSRDDRAVAVLGWADVAGGFEWVAAQRTRWAPALHDLGPVAGHDAELRAGHPQPHLPCLWRLGLVVIGDQLGGDHHDPVAVLVVGQRQLPHPEIWLDRLVQAQVGGLSGAHLAGVLRAVGGQLGQPGDHALGQHPHLVLL